MMEGEMKGGGPVS